MCKLDIQAPNQQELRTFLDAEIRPGGRLADLGFAAYVTTSADESGARQGHIYLMASEETQ
jgi:hypothetical protein